MMNRYLNLTEFVGDVFVDISPIKRPMCLWLDFAHMGHVMARWTEEALPCITISGAGLTLPVKTYKDAERLARELVDLIEDFHQGDFVSRAKTSAALHRKNTEPMLDKLVGELKE